MLFQAEMDNLMNQQQQLHRDKRILEQKMNVSINYKLKWKICAE